MGEYESTLVQIKHLRDSYQDFYGKHDPKNVANYAEHLSKECKRLTEVVELQNSLIADLMNDDMLAEFREVLSREKISPQILEQIKEKDRSSKSSQGCAVVCDTCWIDLDGCAAACTNEVFG